VHYAAGLNRYAASEQVVHLVEQLEFWRTRRMHLRMPAAQLPLEVGATHTWHPPRR